MSTALEIGTQLVQKLNNEGGEACVDALYAELLPEVTLEGTIPQIVERIVDGKIEKFYSESVLLEQPFVKDSDTTVGDMIAEVVGRIRENIQVRRFARYKLGAD